MSQWASAFTESAIGVSKAIGDLAGGNLKTGLLAATVFPVVLVVGLLVLRSVKKKSEIKNNENIQEVIHVQS